MLKNIKDFRIKWLKNIMVIPGSRVYYNIRKRKGSPKGLRYKGMTKKEMINYIEESEMVINFSRSHFERMLKEQVEKFYLHAIEFNKRKGLA